MSNVVTKKFPLSWMKEEDLPWNDDLVVYSEHEVGGGRWMDYVDVVFEDPDEAGAFYQFSYEVGKTEYQECYWYEYLDEEVECTRVEEVEVTVKQWHPVKASQ